MKYKGLYSQWLKSLPRKKKKKIKKLMELQKIDYKKWIDCNLELICKNMQITIKILMNDDPDNSGKNQN